MDIKDLHSEHGQGELVDAWDAEDGGERAATLARRGFLPELTPVFPGVTAPIPQDPLGNDGGPAAPPPWITRLRNCNVRQDFQNFLNALYSFHEEFNKPKYASTFSVMRYPMHAFLQSILSPKPPQDVLISTFSGSMQAQVQLLILKKSGRSNTAAFYRHVNAVCITLTTFINTCQAGIRQFRELEEKGVTHFSPADALANGATNKTTAPSSPARVHQSLVHMEPIGEMIRKIDALDSPGIAPSCTQVVKSSFHYYPRLMILATVLLGFAIGGVLQSLLLAVAELDRFQSSTGIDVRLFLPLLMAAIALIISIVVIIKRMRWMKLDYSARKKAEADDANTRDRKRRIHKQDRSRRLVSSASDDADHDNDHYHTDNNGNHGHRRTISAPIEFDDHGQKQTKQHRAPLTASSSLVARSHTTAPHQQYSSTATTTTAARSYAHDHSSSSSSHGHSSTSGGAYQSMSDHGDDDGTMVTRAAAATIVIETNPFMTPHISGTIAAHTPHDASSSIAAVTQAQAQSGDHKEETHITINPFMQDTTATAAASLPSSSSFVLPPYDATMLGTSPFSAPPPLPGDGDDAKRLAKKKKKSKQSNTTSSNTTSNIDYHAFE